MPLGSVAGLKRSVHLAVAKRAHLGINLCVSIQMQAPNGKGKKSSVGTHYSYCLHKPLTTTSFSLTYSLCSFMIKLSWHPAFVESGISLRLSHLLFLMLLSSWLWSQKQRKHQSSLGPFLRVMYDMSFLCLILSSQTVSMNPQHLVDSQLVTCIFHHTCKPFVLTIQVTGLVSL